MTLEVEASTLYISQLDATEPAGSIRVVSDLDDQIRIIKKVLKATFPNLNNVVNGSDEELNAIIGLAGFAAAGTKVVFMGTPPTGWVQDNTNAGRMLYLSTTAGAIGGVHDPAAPITVVPPHNHAVSLTTSNNAHSHTVTNTVTTSAGWGGTGIFGLATNTTSTYNHTHTVSGNTNNNTGVNAANIQLKYATAIVGVKS